jgi:hypothetical protein
VGSIDPQSFQTCLLARSDRTVTRSAETSDAPKLPKSDMSYRPYTTPGWTAMIM